VDDAAGRWDEALHQYREAQARHPTFAMYSYGIALGLICKGDLGAAATEAGNLRFRFGDPLHATLVDAGIAKHAGHHLEALEILEPHREALMVNRATTFTGHYAYAAAKAGRPEQARQAWLELRARGGPPEPPHLLVALGDLEGARRRIEEGYQQRAAWLRFAACWPELEQLMELPGAAGMLREVGPPALHQGR
jgi:hypothetical protein